MKKLPHHENYITCGQRKAKTENILRGRASLNTYFFFVKDYKDKYFFL